MPGTTTDSGGGISEVGCATTGYCNVRTAKEMGDKFEAFAREECKVRPDSKFTLWCPFCDNWRLTDSMVARKKLGLHISSYHPEETRFERGKKPPELEDVEERKVSCNGKTKVAQPHAL